MTTLTIKPRAVEGESCEVSPEAGTGLSEPRPSGKGAQAIDTLVRAMSLAVVFAGPALICLYAARVNDLDIWWHLRTGQWILQHHAVPRVDPFSGALAGKPWQAYSWLFELIAIKLYQYLGLVGLMAYTSGMILAITVALWHLVKRLQSDFFVVAALIFVTCLSLAHIFTPRPWLFTILFFVLEIDILMQARRTGQIRELAWLPVIFALWANTHIEYIDGLLVLGLALVESIIARWWSAAETQVRPAWMGTSMVASVLATLVNPYGWRIYSVVFDYSSRLATPGGALNMVSELQAVPFRDAVDFLILLLALGCAAALGWRRRFPLFESGLLLFACVASFRSKRDVWVMAVAAAAILASRIVSKNAPTRLPRFATALAVCAAALVVLAGFHILRVNNAELDTQMAQALPVDAVNAVRARGYAGPLYDDYDWGGYLMWALRMPVSIDGRASFYGDQRINRSVATWDAVPDWASDPQLTSAGLVIGPVKAPLTQLLRLDPRFKLVYEDKLAAVFVARR